MSRGGRRSKPEGLVKISPPRLPRVAARERLFKYLDRGLPRGVIWIVGPPGGGKTTLAADWLVRTRHRSLWYQIDATDLDVGTFFRFFRLAVDRVSARRLPPLPPFTPESHLGLKHFSRQFFRAAFSRLVSPFVIVFDNGHEIPPEAPLYSALAEGIDELPEGIALLFLSRSEPPPSLARFDAAQRIERIGGDLLRLTRSEVSAIARLHFGKTLSKETIDRLHADTEGWAAGVILALEYLKKKKTFRLTDHEWCDIGAKTFDYFAGEVFNRLDLRRKTFLLKAAFLPHLTSGIAQRLTGERRAARILAELNRKNYFVSRRVGAESSFEFHPLFRLFLCDRARARFSSSQIVRLHRKAGRLLEREGEIDEAVRLCCEVKDWAGVARLALKEAPTLWAEGRSETLGRWLSALPESVLAGDPWLLYWRGLAALFVDPAEGRAFLQRAFELFQSRGDPAGRTLACAGVIDALLYEMACSKHLDRWISLLEDSLRGSPPFPDPDVALRIVSGLFRALMIRRPDHPEMERWAGRLLERVPPARDSNLRAMAMSDVAWYHLFCGAFPQAAKFIEEMRGLVAPESASPMARVSLKSVEAWHAMLTGRHQECLEAVGAGLALSEESGVSIWDSQMMTHAASSALAAGDLQEAERWISQGEGLLRNRKSLRQESQRLNLSYHHSVAAWLALVKGDIGLARERQTIALEMAEGAGMPFVQSLSRLGMAQILFALGDPRRARAHLRLAEGIAASMRSHNLRFISLLIGAHHSFGLKNGSATSQEKREEEGRKRLREALALGRERGFFTWYWWRAEIMAGLCMKALDAGIETPYVLNLIQRRNLALHHSLSECDRWPWRLKVFTLGRFTLVLNGEPLRFAGKSPRKPLELLQALIAEGGRDVEADRLAELLWPDAEGDAARASFKMTLFHLRDRLGDDKKEMLRFSGNRLTLDHRHCWVDLWLCERLLNQTRAEVQQKRDEQARQLFQRAKALYQGPFLHGEEKSWILPRREHLDRIFRECAEAASSTGSPA